MRELLQRLAAQQAQQSPEAAAPRRSPAVLEDQVDPELAELAKAIQGGALQEQAQAMPPQKSLPMPNDRFAKIKAMLGK